MKRSAFDSSAAVFLSFGSHPVLSTTCLRFLSVIFRFGRLDGVGFGFGFGRTGDSKISSISMRGMLDMTLVPAPSPSVQTLCSHELWTPMAFDTGSDEDDMMLMAVLVRLLMPEKEPVK